MDHKKYLKMAFDMGAEQAVFFRIEDIEFDARTILKCMFGCADWGNSHTCPHVLGRCDHGSIKKY